MSEPLVSVIIPCFNAETTIGAAIDSVLAQSYRNIEVIVIDDGSTDRSLKIADSFSPPLSVHSGPNRGGCAARNLGFELSKGSLIQFLDADDTLSPNKLESQVKLLRDNEKAVATCPFLYVNLDHESISQDLTPPTNTSDPIDWLLTKLETGTSKGMVLHSFLTPRELIVDAGPWNESLRINQDGDFFARVLMKADSVFFTSQTRVFYRRGNEESVSSGRSREHARSALDVCIEYEHLLLQRADSMRTRQALRHSYLTFMFDFGASYPDLMEEASNAIYGLGFKTLGRCGGPKFRILCSLFGFRRALKIRSLAKGS